MDVSVTFASADTGQTGTMLPSQSNTTSDGGPYSRCSLYNYPWNGMISISPDEALASTSPAVASSTAPTADPAAFSARLRSARRQSAAVCIQRHFRGTAARRKACVEQAAAVEGSTAPMQGSRQGLGPCPVVQMEPRQGLGPQQGSELQQGSGLPVRTLPNSLSSQNMAVFEGFRDFRAGEAIPTGSAPEGIRARAAPEPGTSPSHQLVLAREARARIASPREPQISSPSRPGAAISNLQRSGEALPCGPSRGARTVQPAEALFQGINTDRYGASALQHGCCRVDSVSAAVLPPASTSCSSTSSYQWAASAAGSRDVPVIREGGSSHVPVTIQGCSPSGADRTPTCAVQFWRRTL